MIVKGKKVRTKNIYTSGNAKIVYIFAFVFFVLYAISLIFPYLIVVINSFKNLSEYSQSIFSLPKALILSGEVFQNYIQVFERYEIFGMFVNTIILTIGGTILGALFPCVVAFILAKYEFKFRKLIYTLAIVFMMIPSVGTLTATVRLFYDLNLMDTFLGVFCLYASPFGSYFFILYAYYRGLSSTYMEAAYMDGANDFYIFFKIIIPISKGGLATIALLVGLNCWNDYFNPYMYMPNVKTLSTGLQELSANIYGGGILNLFAAIVCMTVPVLIAFFLGGKNMLETVATGGLKE